MNKTSTYLPLPADVEYDELDESLGVHDDSEHNGLPGREERAGDLAGAGGADDEREHGPCLPPADGGDVGLEPAGREVERQEQLGDEVLDALRHPPGELAVLGHRQPEHERAEDGVDPDHVRREPRRASPPPTPPLRQRPRRATHAIAGFTASIQSATNAAPQRSTHRETSGLFPPSAPEIATARARSTQAAT
jgi:hypothetical protein